MNKSVYCESLHQYKFSFLTCSMCVYYFLCSEKFCVEKNIRICQALNFMKRKLSGLFRSMSGFTIGLLLLIRSLLEEKENIVPYCSRLIFGVSGKAIFSTMKYRNFFFIMSTFTDSCFSRELLCEVKHKHL